MTDVESKIIIMFFHTFDAYKIMHMAVFAFSVAFTLVILLRLLIIHSSSTLASTTVVCLPLRNIAKLLSSLYLINLFCTVFQADAQVQ